MHHHSGKPTFRPMVIKSTTHNLRHFTNTKPSISVVVLNYNGKELTDECIASVLKSNYPSFDIVLIDNFSTDDSYWYFKKKYEDYKKIKIFRTDRNRQFTGGFNFGAKKASGDKIVLLSNDITVDPNWLDELVIIAGKNTKFIVQPKIMQYKRPEFIDNIGEKYSWFGYVVGLGRNEKDRGQYDGDLDLDFVSAAVFMIDRNFFLTIGGYDESFVSHYEDVDLCLRAKSLGAKCFAAYKSVVYHKISVTYKKLVPQEKMLFDIRRNRVTVIVKNFHGIEKIVRLFLILILHFMLLMKDFISGKPNLVQLTINATKQGMRQV